MKKQQRAAKLQNKNKVKKIYIYKSIVPNIK